MTRLKLARQRSKSEWHVWNYDVWIWHFICMLAMAIWGAEGN